MTRKRIWMPFWFNVGEWEFAITFFEPGHWRWFVHWPNSRGIAWHLGKCFISILR